MTDLDLLTKVMEASVKRHGDKPITTMHLLNILRMTQRMRLKIDELEILNDEEALEAAYEHKLWGSD